MTAPLYTPPTFVDVPDPTNPPAGAQAMDAATMNAMAQAVAAAQTMAQASSGGTADFGAVPLDSFAGATDDAKLTAAMSAVAADTYPRAIQLTNRDHAFSQINRTAFSGLRIMGPRGYGNPERNGGTKMSSRISLTGAGPWLTDGGATVYGLSLYNLNFVGGSGATVLGAGGGSFYCLAMRDIYSSGLKSVLGTQTSKLLITAAQLDGSWEINNCYSGAFHLGGSDNTLWPAGMLLDSGTAFATAGAANGQYHLWLDGLDKTYIGPIYITAEGAWNALRVSGSGFNSTSTNQGGPVVIHGAKFEGRNPGAPCNGALVRQDGGILTLRDCWVSYGMASPSTPGHTPADAGMVHQEAGQLLVTGCTYDRATGVAETVPFVYTNSNADCIVSNTTRAARGGTWTGRPRVGKPSANTENRMTDATVSLVSL